MTKDQNVRRLRYGPPQCGAGRGRSDPPLGDLVPEQPAVQRAGRGHPRKLAVQRNLFLVGECGGQMVATVLAGYDGHRGCLHLVAVDPAFRRRGFGRALMAGAERRLAAMGCPKVNLQVRASNEAVVAFYKKLGYAFEERVSMGKRLATL